MNIIKHIFFILAVSFFCLSTSDGIFAQDDKWREVTSAEIQMKSPKVEPDAEAEVLFWEVRIVDAFVPRAGFKTTLHHYIRTKIFTERGRENHSKFDIPYGRISDLGVNVTVTDIAARTIRPDGSILNVAPPDIFEQETVKGDGIKLKSKSFALPGLVTGAIVEYRWKEVRTDAVSNYVKLQYSREIPVQTVKYYIKPVVDPKFSLAMRIHSVNIANGFRKDKDDFYSISLESVPAYQPEARMPSESEFRPWSLVYYADPAIDTGSSEKYWSNVAKGNFQIHKAQLKPDNNTRQVANSVAAATTNVEEKIRLIYEFCRRNIKDIDNDATKLTPEQRRDFKSNSSVADTLRRKIGTWHDIDMLFGSMLNTLGLDARIANVSVRSDPMFDRGLTNDYFLRTEIIVVKVGEEWRFFDFSDEHLPYGMLPAAVEGQTALVLFEDEPLWLTTPSSPASSSIIRRHADLVLSEDGTVEGQVRIEYSGHEAGVQKELNDDETAEKREKHLVNMIKSDIHSTAEVTNISILNIEDFDKPLIYTFNIRVPSYAERTGKRLLLSPNIFKRNALPEFRSGSRKYDISFGYGWMEQDEITFKLPKGFMIESSDMPDPVKENAFSVVHQSVLTAAYDNSAINYKRKMAFEGTNGLVFSRSNYPRIKQTFDLLSKADAHAISLRQN